ncbi:MAG: hypothetical protein J7497_09775, partial [Chitinophagaceae bacterium]|nr:hypothetical protein [Chitinophagaceae bacterium]
MKKVNDIHTAIGKGNREAHSWLLRLHLLWLLVLSLTRIRIYLAGIFFHEPPVASPSDILLKAATKTNKLKISKLTGMKQANRFIRVSIVLLFALFTKFASAQTAPFSNTGNDNVCVGVTKSYGVTKVDGSTYSWTISPGTAGVDWILTSLGNTITVEWLKPGTYTLTVIETNSNGCAGDPVQIQITVNPKPVLTITNPQAACAPATVDLTATGVATSTPTGTLTYWTDAAGTNALANPNAVTTSGTYYIKVTTAAGCTDIQPVVVTVNPKPVLTITNPQAACA